MYLVNKGKSFSLEQICADYWKKLNKTRPSGAYHDNALKKKITRAYRHASGTKEKYFYALLRQNSWELLKKLVCAKPSILLQLSLEIDQRVAAGRIPNFYEIVKGKPKSTLFGTEILNLFNYSGLRGSNIFSWLSQSLDLPVCPYCNYEHTISIQRAKADATGRVITKAQHLFSYDHFMIKSMYPYLSASFWNLIPSCHNCNSNLKGNDTFIPDIDIHPYFDNLSKFSVFTLDGVTPLGAKIFNIKFKPTTTIKKQIDQVKRYNDVFCIQERYGNFQGEIEHLNRERAYYDDSAKEYLLNNGFKALKFSDMNEVGRHIAERLHIPLSSEQAIKHEKGKFRVDLAKEFGITTYKGADLI